MYPISFVIPVSGQDPAPGTYHDAALYYNMWAHKVNPTHPLYIGDVKIDTLFTPAHKRALQDYYATRGSMVQRFLQVSRLVGGGGRGGSAHSLAIDRVLPLVCPTMTAVGHGAAGWRAAWCGTPDCAER